MATISAFIVLSLAYVSAQDGQDALSAGRPFTVRPRLGAPLPGGPGIVEYREVKRPGVALVLSGGGARGLASIGVLASLEKHNVPIDMIVGTSIGSIVGGLYAVGYSPDDLRRIALTTNWDEVLSYNDEARRTDMFLDQKMAADRSILVLRFEGLEPIIPGSYSTGQRLTNFLNLLVLQGIYRPDPTFDALRIPFRAVTTDLISGRQYVFREGDLSAALRASVAVPLLFSTVQKDSMQLLDGGLLSNMPVDVARNEGIEFVIVVDVTSPLRPASQVVAPWEVAEQIMGIVMQQPNAEAREKADIVITPDLKGRISSDFSDVESLIAAGEASSDAAMPLLWQRLHHEEKRVEPVSAILSVDRTRADIAEEDEQILQAFAPGMVLGTTTLQKAADDLQQTGNYKQLSIDVSPDSGGVRLTLTAERYPVLRSVAFEAVASVPEDSLLSLFGEQLGRHINARAAHGTIERIVSVYREEGYSLAHVENISFDETTGHAVIRMDEGVIARMKIRGTTKTRDYVIWRELPFKDGDVFRVSKVAQGIANIYSTNLFEQVSVTVEHEGPNEETHILVFNLRERSTELIRLGLRLDNERSFQPWMNIKDENFLGAAAELGLSLGGGTRNQSVVADLKAHRIFDSYFTSRLQAYYHSRDVNMYMSVPGLPEDRFERRRIGEIREIHRGGALSLGSQLERLGDVTIEGRLERVQVYNIEGQAITNENYNISSVSFGTRVDTQDKIPFPSTGVNMRFQYESALVRTASSIGYTKLMFDYESFQTYGERHTLHPRVMFGLGDDAVPTSEQFSLGGQPSFYGYREDNARGRQILYAGLEYRYKLPFRIYFDTYVSARYDVGAVWLRADEIRLEDLQHGIGVGVGFDTPFGPALFSVGRSFIIQGDLLNKPVALGPALAYFSLGYYLN